MGSWEDPLMVTLGLLHVQWELLHVGPAGLPCLLKQAVAPLLGIDCVQHLTSLVVHGSVSGSWFSGNPLELPSASYEFPVITPFCLLTLFLEL